LSGEGARARPQETTRARGQRAETLAAQHLEAQGYRVVERSFRCKVGEVDLIAWDGSVLCFVEVRSRATDDFGDPLETIGPQKIRRIVRAAGEYLVTFKGPWPEMRFDAVGIVMSESPVVTLLRGAFEAHP
jgi:putative endonuclease